MKIRILLSVIVLLSGLVFNSGCAAKKQAKLEKQRQEALLEASKNELKLIISGNDESAVQEKENKINKIKSYNFRDIEIGNLIVKAEEVVNSQKQKEAEEERIKREKEEELKRLEQEKNKTSKSAQEVLEEALKNIGAAATKQEADQIINSVIPMFTSKDANVLIIISEENGEKDYDKPTTIIKYLELLKDTKKQGAKIYQIHYDNDKKIKTLELKK